MQDPTTAILILFCFVIFSSVAIIGRHILNRIEQYQYFAHYLGPHDAQFILSTKYAGRLYKLLKLYKTSGTGEAIFDTALRLHARRESDEEELVILQDMLYFYDSNLFKKFPVKKHYTDNEFHQYWYNQAKYTSRYEIYRLMIWLLLMNRQGIRRLKEI